MGFPGANKRSGYIPPIPALDGIRAIAVIAVLLYHADLLWIPGGFLGVEVFFVLSGFLITALLWSELVATSGLGLRGFWGRRARRLLPALFGLLLVTLAAFLIGWPHEIAAIRGDVAAAFTYSSNWYLIGVNRSYFQTVGRPSPFGHLWSLAIEEQFYLLWPLALMLLFKIVRKPKRVAGFIGGAALLSAIAMWVLYNGNDPSRVYYGTDTRAAGLLIGAALAVVWRPWTPGYKVKISPRLLELAALGAAGILVWAFWRWDEFSSFTYRPGIQLVALASAVLIAASVHPETRLRAVLGSRPLKWIGRRSYGIYLWHWPIYVVTRPGIDIGWSSGPTLVLRLGLTLILAELSFRYLEEPIRRGALSRLGRRFAARARSARVQRRRLQLGWATASGAFLLALGLIIGGVVSAPTPALSASQLALINGVPAVAPVTTEHPDTQPTAPATTGPLSVVAVGDSVMVDTQNALRAQIPGIYVDALVGRHLRGGISVLRALRNQNRLGDVVVIHLGTNGAFTTADFDNIMQVLQNVPRVVFVNLRVPRRWETPDNLTIAAGVSRYPNTVLLDWHDRWRECGRNVFWSDGIHPTPSGAACYARMVAAVVQP
ncbi:MAG TPA: acyltransferase family protein [Actinomycetota bacterium]|nr:acyltransferase family protein [Actinomycetota bacterium]